MSSTSAKTPVRDPSKAVDESSWTEEEIKRVANLFSMTDEQLLLFRDLQGRLADVDHWKNCPYGVAGFFMGPEGHNASERLFREMVQWRREHSVDTIREDYSPPRLVMKHSPIAVLQGVDRDGDPIYVDRGGVTDPKGLKQRFGREEMYKYAVWLTETITEGSWNEDYRRRVGRRVRGFTVIYDLQGLSSKQMNADALEAFKTLTEIKNHFMLPLRRLIIIRAPAIFRLFWGMVKHLIPKANQKKIVFAGANNYLEVLDRYMDRKVLPPCICPTSTGEIVRDLRGVELHGGELPPPCDSDLDRLNTTCKLDESTTSMTLSSDDSTSTVEAFDEEDDGVRVKRLTSGYWKPGHVERVFVSTV